MAQNGKKTIRALGVVCFILYLILLVYFLFFAEEYGRTGGAISEYRYNLTPFKEIMRFLRYSDKLGFRAVLINIGGNILAFAPFGFFLPALSGRIKNGLAVTLLGFLLSAAVECVQLVTKVGICDVDDVILNTVGTFAGYLCYRIGCWFVAPWWSPKHSVKKRRQR